VTEFESAEICGNNRSPGAWPYVTTCVAPPGHADLHLDRKGRMWKDARSLVEEPSKQSIARLRAIGHNKWADQALAEYAKAVAVRKAGKLPPG